jgi:hypothetical protein
LRCSDPDRASELNAVFTHLPPADSPALERGSNPRNYLYDQRGCGYSRLKGAFPDIGAVER